MSYWRCIHRMSYWRCIPSNRMTYWCGISGSSMTRFSPFAIGKYSDDYLLSPFRLFSTACAGFAVLRRSPGCLLSHLLNFEMPFCAFKSLICHSFATFKAQTTDFFAAEYGKSLTYSHFTDDIVVRCSLLKFVELDRVFSDNAADWMKPNPTMMKIRWFSRVFPLGLFDFSTATVSPDFANVVMNFPFTSSPLLYIK